MTPINPADLPDLGYRPTVQKGVLALFVWLEAGRYVWMHPPMPVFIWRDGKRIRESVSGYEHYLDDLRGSVFYPIEQWREVWADWESRCAMAGSGPCTSR
jgi:hypothetical protein